MLFQTVTFFVFFAIFFGVYYASRNYLRLQNILILAGSYVFYGAWDERFLTLIIASTATDYFCGIGASGAHPTNRDLLKTLGYLAVGSTISLGIALPDTAEYFAPVACLAGLLTSIHYIALRLESGARRRLFVASSVIINVTILGIFKYFNFFVESIVDLGNGLGFSFDYGTLSIILPVGISFYTFQTLSYSIDIYRGKLKPTSHMLELAAFVSFFPQLVAGPVERAANLLPQFFQVRRITRERLAYGMTLFIWGLFKKVVIADRLAPIADAAFADPGVLTTGELLAGLLAFTFQIYADFSGYSDMARGIARMLGFDLMLNFNIPYIARTPSEFWQRWHISLSSWLRDYLYISLGGNRLGKWKTYRNLALTMLLGGLWHGASWTFVLWGAYQGGILVIYRALRIDEWLSAARNSAVVVKYLRDAVLIGIMFLLTMAGWLIFRANTMEILANYWDGIFAFRGTFNGPWAEVFEIIWPLVLVQGFQVYFKDLEAFWRMPYFVRLNIALFAIYSIAFLGARGTQAFIYFDF